MAKLTAKDGVVEIVPSDSGIKVLKETDGVKTIQVETPFNKKERKTTTAQGDQPKSIDPQHKREQRKQKQKSARERIQKRRMTEDYAYTDKFNTKGPHSRVAEATAKGVRIARRGGGRAYGKNS